MKTNKIEVVILYFCLLLPTLIQAKTVTYRMTDYGIYPNSTQNASPLFVKALQQIKLETNKNDKINLVFENGTYHFHPEDSFSKEYYISNHDQDNPKRVGIALEGMHNLTLDGEGSNFLFHGRMIPISIIDGENITIKNLSIDFVNPQIAQAKIIKNDTTTGSIVFQMAPWVKYKLIDKNLTILGKGWSHTPRSGIAFEEQTKRVVYNSSDIALDLSELKEIAPYTIQATQWKNKKLIPGTVIAMRDHRRPTPGIFVSLSKNIELLKIRVHYAEGMGLLAQMTENITLNQFCVCLRGKNDPRYFTTQADATHFSACKGKIISINGLYEGMMDDAINVHGTYLKITKQIDNRTVIANYMHNQSWGFKWGMPGDSVQFILSEKMQLTERKNVIETINAIDKPSEQGAKAFQIRFKEPLEEIITLNLHHVGVENLEWTPEVYFANNIIRNNRARGSLFSTPKQTIVEHNFFDHTSGTAILLCGDCNGWFETGACRNVIIRHNHFKNALTSMFQFTNAVISIYPEIPNLRTQTKYFHGGKANAILIEKNTFDVFDAPLLYAKSIDGLTFRKNKIKTNKEYPFFHWNRYPFFFERVKRVNIENNNLSFDRKKDLKTILTEAHDVTIF